MYSNCSNVQHAQSDPNIDRWSEMPQAVISFTRVLNAFSFDRSDLVSYYSYFYAMDLIFDSSKNLVHLRAIRATQRRRNITRCPRGVELYSCNVPLRSAIFLLLIFLYNRLQNVRQFICKSCTLAIYNK